MAKQDEMMKILKQLQPPPVYNETLESPYLSTHIFQGANAEFAAIEGYAQYESGYL